MYTKLNKKKAFTLIEIIIVITIISLVYFFTLGNFKFDVKTTTSVNLEYLPKYLNKFKFSNTLELKCIEEGKRCLLYLDGSIKEELKDLFKEKPSVYTYDKNLDIIYFDDIELKELDRYEVCFIYSINKYKKSKDLIVEVGQKVYIFNSFNPKAIILEYLSDVRTYFDNKEQEVSDAF